MLAKVLQGGQGALVGCYTPNLGLLTPCVISFLPCFIWSLSTSGEENLWDTLLQRAGVQLMSQAE